MPEFQQVDDESSDAFDMSLKDAVVLFKDSASSYVGARKELFTIEAKEAAEYSGRKVAALAVVALTGLFTWLLLMAAFVAALGYWFSTEMGMGGYGWAVAALCLSLIHLMVLFVFLAKFKKKPESELFEMTKAELNKDKQWLQEAKFDNVS